MNLNLYYYKILAQFQQSVGYAKAPVDLQTTWGTQIVRFFTVVAVLRVILATKVPGMSYFRFL